jgi:transposase
MRKLFSPTQKASVAIETLKGFKTINQISSHYEAHPTQVGLWRKQLIDNAHTLFTDKRKRNGREEPNKEDELCKLIGARDLEIMWLKKKLHFDT